MEKVPQPVAGLLEAWDAAGRSAQGGIAWPRARWNAVLPGSTLEGLPDRLTREAVRKACVAAAGGPAHARQAFVAVMAWGFGTVGYGPWRTVRMLDAAVNPDADARLADVAGELALGGPLAAYRMLAKERRLRFLGPAFGTKFLYFCPQARAGLRALILDQLVARWLATNTGVRFNPRPWSPATYSRYLDLMHHWADQLAVPADAVEERIFVGQATAEGGQWAGG